MIETIGHLPIPEHSVERPLVSVVMPCLNEAEALPSCIHKIHSAFAAAGVTGEIVVCDNGSTDNSVAIAESLGARVVHQPLRGYGNAYIKGFEFARGDYLIMGDADDTYDFTQIPQFLDYLRHRGCDFVTGSRYLKGGQGKIPLLHRIIGNPALTALLNFLFGTHYTDVYCGFRGFTRQAYDLIQPVSPGMEFNLELAINAGLASLNIAELPILLHPRKGESKLRTFQDGWRSLRMMLIYCPNKVFLFPGLSFLATGLLIHLVVLLDLIKYNGRPLGAVTGIVAAILSVVGFEVLSLGLHVKTYSWSRRFDRDNAFLRWFYSRFTLEVGLIIGLATALVGSIIMTMLIIEWFKSSMMPIPQPGWASFAATLIIIGIGTIFSSLFISAMSMKKGH